MKIRQNDISKGWLVGWGLTALSAQIGHIVPLIYQKFDTNTSKILIYLRAIRYDILISHRYFDILDILIQHKHAQKTLL